MISQVIRASIRARVAVPRVAPRAVAFARVSPVRLYTTEHEHREESFEEFTARYESEFENAYDLFEVQRILNNCFSYDLVPAPAVIEKALQACRRVNDYPTAVRVFEALQHKVENKEQYRAYLDELADVRKELGIDLKEELFAGEQ